MKRNLMLTITSLLSILLLSFHLTQDALREIGGLFAGAMPVLHLTSPRFGLVPRPGAGFFMWTLIALGVTGTFSIILAGRDLWNFKRGE
jgi:hypothetical protein